MRARSGGDIARKDWVCGGLDGLDWIGGCLTNKKSNHKVEKMRLMCCDERNVLMRHNSHKICLHTTNAPTNVS